MNEKKKQIYVEKVLYKQNYYTDDVSKRRQFEIKRSNNNLMICGKRWNTQYNTYSLIPNTKLSTGYNDGILYLINLLDQALLKLNDLVIDESMYDTEVFSADVANARDEKFEIIIKVTKAGLAYLLLQVSSNGSKDIIPIEEKDLVSSDTSVQAQPFYVREIQNMRDKLYNFAYDAEAQDKFNFKLVSANKEEKEVKAETKEENSKVDDFVF